MARIPDGFRPAWLRRLDAKPALARHRAALRRYDAFMESIERQAPVVCAGEGPNVDLANVVAMSTARIDRQRRDDNEAIVSALPLFDRREPVDALTVPHKPGGPMEELEYLGMGVGAKRTP